MSLMGNNYVKMLTVCVKLLLDPEPLASVTFVILQHGCLFLALSLTYIPKLLLQDR